MDKKFFLGWMCAMVAVTTIVVAFSVPRLFLHTTKEAGGTAELFIQQKAEADNPPLLLDSEDLFKPVDIVFLGDSLTARGDWEALSKNLHIVNMGVNYDTIADLTARLDQIAELKPRALFLLIGINDLGVRMRPVVYQDYDQLLDDLVATLPNTQIYVQSVLPVRDDVRTIMSNTVLVEVNEQIQAMAQAHELTYIDVFSSLPNPEENELYLEYQIDGLHLSKAGYAVWETVLAPYIQNLE